MYRTEKIYQRIKDTNLKYPICVPSYDRPNNFFIEWVKSNKFDIPKDNLYLFIRNTPEQIALYKHLRKLVNIVLISKDTIDLGDTRAQIVRWGQKHNHELLFMLDDTVKGIWWLSTVERKNQTYLDISKQSSPKTSFQIWAEEHIQNGMVASGISWKGFHWMPDRVNKSIEPLNNGTYLSNCIAISPMKWLEADINYKSIEEAGVEDIFIMYNLLIHRQPFCNMSDICFEIKVDPRGGDNSVYPNQKRSERLLKVKKGFWKKTLGLEWGEKHPGFSIVKGRSEDEMIRTNLSYWRKYYANTK